MSTELNTPEATSERYRNLRWNYNCLRLDGTFFNFGSSFIEANTMFPTFVSLLTDSPLLIGLVSTVRTAGYLLPQLLVAAIAHGRPLKKPILAVGGLVNRLSLLIIVLAAYFLANRPTVGLPVFFLGLVLFSLSDGIGGVPWVDIVARAIPNNRRGRLFGSMMLFGGLGSFTAGFIITAILSHPRLPFPANYALNFGCGLVLLSISYFCTMLVREPVPERPPTRLAFAAFFRRLPDLWRANLAFRRMIGIRLALSSFYLALPFYAVYARTVLGFPPSIVGIFVSAQMAGSILGGLLWGYLGDHHGNRLVIRLVGLTALSTPLLALAAGLALGAHLRWLAVAFYLLLFASLGATFNGVWMGFTNYLIEIVDDDNRPTFIGLMNTMVAPLAFLPILGGWLVRFLNYPQLFGVTAILVFSGFLWGLRLPEPRHQTHLT